MFNENALTYQQALSNTYQLLSKLLDTNPLDIDAAAEDCLALFDKAHWSKKSGADGERFDLLFKKAIAKKISNDEFFEFMSMVCDRGPVMPFHTIANAILALEQYKRLVTEKENTELLETYQVLVLSTGHLTGEDITALDEQVDDGHPMVLKRDTGYFLKLYTHEVESNFDLGHSEAIKVIIRYAFENGFQMIEFDGDAPCVTLFPVYEH